MYKERLILYGQMKYIHLNHIFITYRSIEEELIENPGCLLMKRDRRRHTIGTADSEKYLPVRHNNTSNEKLPSPVKGLPICSSL